MIPLTKLEGVPEKSQVISGMAYFAGTGPADMTCGDCKFRGMWRKKLANDQTYRTQACAMFKKLAGRYGPVVKKSNPSCKYFEKREIPVTG